MIEALKDSDLEGQRRLLDFSMKLYKENPRDNAQLRLRSWIQIRPLLSKLLESKKEEYRVTVRAFLLHLLNRK